MAKDICYFMGVWVRDGGHWDWDILGLFYGVVDTLPRRITLAVHSFFTVVGSGLALWFGFGIGNRGFDVDDWWIGRRTGISWIGSVEA